MKPKTVYLAFFFIPFLFAQSDVDQVEIKTITKIDVPFAGTMTFSNTIHAANGKFKEEVESSFDRFYTRMAMGGNRTAGKIINYDDQSLIMYSESKKQFAAEDFQTIKNNDGTPSLKDVTRMNPGGNNDRDRESNKSNSEDKADQNSNERPKPTVERIISKDLEQVNQFTCKKVITKISSSSGVFTMVEWITEDTLILNYADSVQRDLVESYGGTLSPQPSSSSWVSRIEPKKKHEVVNGKIIKSSMTSFNEKGKPSFSMQMEISSAKEVDFNPLMFTVPKNYRKVDELE